MGKREAGGGGKAVVDDEAKLFNEGKFGVGKPNAGNAPNGDNDGKPNGKPQGRSKNSQKSLVDQHSNVDEPTIEGSIEIFLLLFCHRFFAIVTHRRRRRCSSSC